MTNEEFEWYYQKYYVKDRMIQRIARKKAGADQELYKDLVQEGLIKLSKLKPARATKNVDSWIRTSISNGMTDFLRKYKPNKYTSLESRMLAGDQLEKDPSTGELRLFSHIRHPGSGHTLYTDPFDESVVDVHITNEAPEEQTTVWDTLLDNPEALSDDD